MSFIYWLSLDNDKFYVGRTSDIKRRIGEHFLGDGAKWTKLNKPRKVLGYTTELGDKHEDYMTLLMMKKHGVENVRGGKWCMQFFSDGLKAQLRAFSSFINESKSIEENMNNIEDNRMNYIIETLMLKTIDTKKFGNDTLLWNELISFKKCVKCKGYHNMEYFKPFCYNCWKIEAK